MRTTLRMAALALAALLAGCGATIDRITGEGDADRIRRVGQRGDEDPRGA